MKQNLLFNRASAICKRLAMVLTMLLTIGIGQAWGADTWTLVKDASDLAVGDEVVIAASGSDYALGTTQNDNNRAAVSITKNGDNITWTTAVQVLTLEAGKTSSTFALHTENGYLYAASSSKNYLRTETTLSDNSSWTISITSAGIATIKATGSNTRNWLRYNGSNNPVIFSCYSSGQNDVAIYKKQATVTNTLSSITLSGQTTTYNVGDSFSFDGTCTAKYSDGSTKTVTPTSVSSPDMNNAGTPTVTVSYTEGGITVKATYTITVSAVSSGDGECTWELVTDASTLKAGDRVVIAAKDYSYAISTTQNGNNRGQASVTKNTSNNTITFGDDVQILTLEEGTKSGTLAFNTGDGYLYAASSSKNYMRTETTLSDNSSWEITIDSDGVATIIAQGTNTRNELRYNSSNNPPIFSCYSSGQNDVVIYKEVCTGGSTETLVSLYPNGGTGEKEELETTEGSLTLPDCTFTRDGYRFVGWNTKDDGSGTTYQPGETYTPTENPANLYAKWAKEYTITYDANGGTTTCTDNNKYIAGDQVTICTSVPNRDGYEFNGWSYSPEVSVTSGKFTMPESNVTITAQWKAIEYNITYNGLEGATHSNPDKYTIESETIIFTNPSERVGYKFNGWNPASIAKGTTGDKTVTAQWTAKPLTNYRTFCDVVCDAYSFHTGTGEKETWLKEAIKCFVEAEGGFEHEWQIKDYIIPEDDKFFVGNYGYFYNDNLGIGGANGKSRSVVSDWGNMYLAPAMDENDAPGTPRLGHAKGAKGTLRIFEDSNWDNLFVGFIPDGYKLKFGDEEYTFAKTIGTEYRSDVVQYNSTNADKNVSVGVVDADGKYVATNHTQEMRHIFLEVSKPLDGGSWADANAKFAIYYWNNSTNGWCGFMKNVPSETTLYEGWVPADATGFKFVRYNSNQSAPGSWDNDKAWNQTGDLTFQQVQENGNLFTITDWGTGTWSTYEKYGQFAMHDNSKSKNWYVHFVPHYELTYDKNAADATGEMAKQTVAVDADDKKVIVADCGFTRLGYEFIKWKYDETLNYTAGVSITLNKDITLYALWQAKNITITWNPNGGTVSPTSSIYTYNGASVDLPIPTREGYSFNGWFTDRSGGKQIPDVGNTNKPTEDVTYYAQWTEKATPTFAWSAATCTAALEADNTFPTLSNPDNLHVTYKSSDENVAKIDVNGNVILGAVGTTKITADGAETATHKSATDSYTLTVNPSNCRWVETEIGDIQPDDEVVVAMTDGVNTWALDQDYYDVTNSKYPLATKLDIVGTEIRDALNANNLKWNISGNADDGYILYPNGQTSAWLYCTGSSNTIKIGNSSSKHFVIENDYLKSKSKVTTSGVEVDAYLGVSPSTESWRHYPNTSTSVIAGQTLKFYKRECLDPTEVWVEGNLTNVSCTPQLPQIIAKDGGPIILTFTAAEGYALPTSVSVEMGSTTLTPSWNRTTGELTINAPVGGFADNVLVTVEAVKVYTVIWYDGEGNAHHTQTVTNNTIVTLPTTNPDPCDDDYPHFIGWTADPIVGSTTTQPALVEESVIVTGDCDYYAVFAKGEGGSSDYKLVTSAPADWSGTYLIVNTDDKKAWKGSATSDNGAIDVTITNNTIPSNATIDNETFTIATMTGGYSIKGTSGKYISGTSGDNKTTYNNVAQLNTISIDNNNNVTITSNTSVLRQNNSNASLFRYYKSSSYSSQHPIQLYKKGSGVNYTSYITTCCTSWTAPTLTYPTELEENGTAMPQLGAGTTHGTVTYASSNPSILSVNSTTGEISAQAPGTATVTATWSGDETYCSVSSTSNVITVKGSFSVIYKANGGTGTMANQKADENNKIAQLNANQFTRTGYAFVGWNTSSDGTGTAYTDQQTNITLAQNLTLYAQWAPVVTLNDAGNEETAHPTTVNGTITLPNGENACDPYEFVGWTSVATADWNGEIEEPELVTSPYKPTAPITLYAVYKIQSKGNSNAFKLSFEVSGTTYYVGSINSDPYIKGFSNITADDAVTFYKEKIENNTEKYWVYFERYDSYYDETTKEYLYLYNGNDINTTNSPSETQGWILITLSNGLVQFKDITYEKYFSFTDGGNLTDHSAGSQKSFNLLPAVSSTYYAIPDCDKEIKITFETGNGDFVANTPATNPLVVTSGETITLPICEYPGDGIEFIGWLKNTPQEELSDVIADGYYVGGEEYVVEDTRDVIFYAYYKVTPEEVEFTGQDDAELKIYHYNGVDNYYYANTFVGEHAELSGIKRCFDATTWKFTNVGNMQYYIQDETGKYLGAVSDSDNDFSLSNTPKIWNFTLIDGLWRMICEDSPSRALMYISTGKNFANAALTNISNSAYSYVTLGICPDDGYTTQPVLSQGFSITNTAMVTSASGQKVKAASALTLETRNLELPCTFTIAAPNITFYDNTGAEVTQLTASAASEQFELHFAYKPTAENTMEYPTITITDDEHKTYTIKNRIYARSLPATFAIVAKVGNIWYALPSQGLNSTTPPAAYPVEVDDIADPTAVTAVPANADWSLRGVYEASRSDATKDRYVANGDNLVFVNNASPAMVLNASSSEEKNYLLTDAQYNNYYSTNPGLYEWTPTTTDLETYQLTNEQRSRTLSVNIATVFGVHAQDKAVEQVRFLPIQNRYTPAALQVVEWKENSVVIMYNGDPAQTASVSVNGAAAQNTKLSAAERDIAVYELAATGLAANPTQRLSITIGTEKVILSIPYIISGAQTDLALLPGSTVAARQEVAKVADLVVLKDAKLTAAGSKSDPYKFRNVTIYGGGKLVIPSEKGFGVSSLTMRVGAVESGNYKALYPQLVLNGNINTGNINIDYLTTYDRYYALSLPYSANTLDILYPAEIYGDNLKTGNTASFTLQWYDGKARASETRKGWTNLDEPATLEPYKGYTFWGAPRKVSVNGESKRQNFGIHRIPIKPKANDLITGETSPKQIVVEAYSATNAYDAGWNFIGNPYLAQYGNMEDGHTSGLLGALTQNPETGVWEHIGNYRYITLTDDGKTYWQTPVSEAELYPFNTFFVQAGEYGAVSFNASNRASLPARHYAAQQETAKEITTGIILTDYDQTDRTGLLIADNFTEEYDFNADLSKFENSGINLYTIGKDGKLAYMAINQALAEQPIPLGYSAPTDGEYTFAFDEDRYSATDINALYLIDYDRNETTNLLHTDYSFVTTAGTNNERFALQVAFIPQNATSVEWVDDATIQVAVDGNNLLLNNLPTDAGVQVFDALGRVIYATPNAPTEMQITLPTGYYLVRIADKQHAVVINTVIP